MPTTTMPSTENDISIARKLPIVRKCGRGKAQARMQSARMIAINPASRIDPSLFQEEHALSCRRQRAICQHCLVSRPSLSSDGML